jgi:GNAT superfamily N-acetyltransferase
MIEEITFDEIKPFWKILWPDLKLEERSGRLLLFGWNESIVKNDNIKVTYFGAKINNKIVGVNSGFSPEPFQFRSRGLFVLPEYRKQGISQELLKATEDKAREDESIITLWSMPRKPALHAYIKFGFKVLSDFKKEIFDENCFVMKGVR